MMAIYVKSDSGIKLKVEYWRGKDDYDGNQLNSPVVVFETESGFSPAHYYAGTLIGAPGFFGRNEDCGLCLHGAMREYDVPRKEMRRVKAWIKRHKEWR